MADPTASLPGLSEILKEPAALQDKTDHTEPRTLCPHPPAVESLLSGLLGIHTQGLDW